MAFLCQKNTILYCRGSNLVQVQLNRPDHVQVSSVKSMMEEEKLCERIWSQHIRGREEDNNIRLYNYFRQKSMD